jgi:hypothetical protein
MTDAPSPEAEWPPEVQDKLARIAALAAAIDAHSTALDASYHERMDLYLELRALEPPVPYTVIGEATGTEEAAVRIGISKELKRCEEVAKTTTGPEKALGRRSRAGERIAVAQQIRHRERAEREAGNGAVTRRPRTRT